MQLGAGVELATAAVPHLFLPMACAANVMKVLLLRMHQIRKYHFVKKQNQSLL